MQLFMSQSALSTKQLCVKNSRHGLVIVNLLCIKHDQASRVKSFFFLFLLFVTVLFQIFCKWGPIHMDGVMLFCILYECSHCLSLGLKMMQLHQLNLKWQFLSRHCGDTMRPHFVCCSQVLLTNYVQPLKVKSFIFLFLDFWITGVTVHDYKSSLLGKLCRLWRLYGYAELTVMFENTLSCWKEPSEDEYTVIMIGWTGSATVLRYIVVIK